MFHPTTLGNSWNELLKKDQPCRTEEVQVSVEDCLLLVKRIV